MRIDIQTGAAHPSWNAAPVTPATGTPQQKQVWGIPEQEVLADDAAEVTLQKNQYLTLPISSCCLFIAVTDSS